MTKYGDHNVSEEDYRKTVAKTGREPINPIGACFDSSFIQLYCDHFGPLKSPEAQPSDRLVHAIGIANMPGQEGRPIVHAWIEFDGPGGERLAYDSTWGTVSRAKEYRDAFHVTYAVEYSPAEANALARIHDRSGPWDDKICQV